MKRRKSSILLHSIWLFRSLALFFFLFLPQKVYADGKYFPEQAYKATPAIPSQRAILAYKDGIEKLTIESALDGQGREFGWIIPLPAKPTEFEKVSPGLIKTLSLIIQPEITHDLTSAIVLPLLLAAIITFWCLSVLVGKPKHPLYRLLTMLLIALFLGSILMPALGPAGGGARIQHTEISGVRIQDVQHVGAYNLAVLQADTAAALDKWLARNGFAGLADEDRKVISDYIADNWCFVAARLRREGSGYSRPHPLAMSFPSDKPIYPMRLTATTGSPAYLELFVIAEKKATCDKLTCELSDTYAFVREARQSVPDREFLSGFAGRRYRQGIGHPETKRIMWDGCVLSKLCGVLTPTDMTEDIVVGLATDQPSQEHYYSRQGAKHTAVMASLTAWCILLPVFTGMFYITIESRKGRKFYLLRIIIPCVLLSFLLWAVTYTLLPKVEVVTTGNTRLPPFLYDYRENHNMLTEKEALARENDYFKDVKIREIMTVVETHFKAKDYKNAFTGENIKHEDSPGNYTVFEDARGVVLRNYSIEGYPHDFVLTSEPEKSPST
ncbi:MAG: DUF2330 domain-containing protein [Planctomycetota bacterium]